MFDVPSWSDTGHNVVKLKKAQHLLGGGLLNYSGNLDDLRNTYILDPQIESVQKKMFAGEFRTLYPKSFGAVVDAAIKNRIQAEGLVSQLLAKMCSTHYAVKGVAVSRPYVKTQAFRGVSTSIYIDSELLQGFEQWIREKAGSNHKIEDLNFTATNILLDLAEKRRASI